MYFLVFEFKLKVNTLIEALGLQYLLIEALGLQYL